jgi:hypothetical protein
MKYTEYLGFAILLAPTAAVLTAGMICLTADRSAPSSDGLYNTVVSAYWGVTASEH